MRFMKTMAAGLFGAALLMPRVAAADEGKLASVQEAVKGLEARAQAVRDRAGKSQSSTLKKESERIVAVVDAERIFLATRLQIFSLLGDVTPDDELVDDTAARASRADRLMATVERWFVKR